MFLSFPSWAYVRTALFSNVFREFVLDYVDAYTPSSVLSPAGRCGESMKLNISFSYSFTGLTLTACSLSECMLKNHEGLQMKSSPGWGDFCAQPTHRRRVSGGGGALCSAAKSQ